MFYRPTEDGHGLPHNPFKAIVSPRPIGWISSRDAAGNANLAPYSFFNGVGEAPPMVMFGAGNQKIGQNERKDSVANILETEEFCVNMVSSDLADAMNITSGHYPRDVDEFARAGLSKATGRVVDVPYVRDAPAVLECRLFKVIDLPGSSRMVIGEVVGIHINDAHLKDGILDVTSYRPLARLGYKDYTSVSEVFALERPE
ncbi:MAG: flavin reductase family protein [Rhodobacteraceae bacterium]|nr:flavin reductase family protein [Paracoccaceae bacterium]